MARRGAGSGGDAGVVRQVAAWGREPVTNIGAGLAGLTFGFFMETTLFVLRSSSSIAETDRRKKQRKQVRVPTHTNSPRASAACPTVC